MTTDVLIDTQESGADWDLFINEEGDLTNGDFFDSSLYYSILGERRASASEVSVSEYRRGWIGNEGANYENGSKIWLYYQSRISSTTLGNIETEALQALQWLIDDGYLVNIEVRALFRQGLVILQVDLFRSDSKVDRRFYTLWDNTGVKNAA